jgi:hypothetical protein
LFESYEDILPPESGIENLSPEEIKLRNEEMKDSFEYRWGWMAMINSLCDDGKNIILRNAWMDSNFIEFLNELSYLKEIIEIRQKKQN